MEKLILAFGCICAGGLMGAIGANMGAPGGPVLGFFGMALGLVGCGNAVLWLWESDRDYE